MSTERKGGDGAGKTEEDSNQRGQHKPSQAERASTERILLARKVLYSLEARMPLLLYKQIALIPKEMHTERR